MFGHLKEVKKLRKVKMTWCKDLSPSLIATICVGLCSSNSTEEVVVTSRVSVLSVASQHHTNCLFLSVNYP